MPARITRASNQENVSSTLNGSVTAAALTITIADATNFLFPSYAVIDRVDGTGTRRATSLWEYVYISAISGNDLTVTRAQGGSTGQTHSSGAVIEALPTAALWEDFRTSYLNEHGSEGAHVSLASTNYLRVITRADVSGASVTGFGIYPAWRSNAAYSGPTTMVGGLLSTPRPGQIQWVSVLTRTVASGTSVGFDIMKNGTSIFSNATTRPAITAGGTFVSTSSIATRNIDSGDILQFNVDSMVAGAGLIVDITGQLGTS